MTFLYMQFCAEKEKNVDTHMRVIIRAMKATIRAGATEIWALSVISALTEVKETHILLHE